MTTTTTRKPRTKKAKPEQEQPTEYKTVTPEPTRLATLEIGLAGCHGATTTGGSMSIYDYRIERYYGMLAEGGYVLIKTKALDENPGLVVRSPMVKGNLPPGTTDGFTKAYVEGSIVAQALATDPGGYGPLARLMLADPECGGFDYVSPEIFAAWWSKRGATIGIRQGDRIQWADGTATEIDFANQN